ncbi:MAG: DUF3159 domain-containing protein [Actinobacteria bacterium]|nr:DUF3159 domain-containing protein [Actinomycetota bacterium]
MAWSIIIADNTERDTSSSAGTTTSRPTVEGEVRARLAAELGGVRGSLETAFPLVVFTVVFVATDEVRPSVIWAMAAAVAAYGLRLAQRSQTRYVRHGLVGIVVAAALASFTGRAETAFLPGIVQNGVWALVLGGSVVVRWPVAGFVIGEVLGDRMGWRDDPAIVRLSNRLTLVLLAPMVIRLAVQLPLYVADEVLWLGVSRVVLGWPLHAGTLALVGLILVRGNTPLRREDADADASRRSSAAQRRQ